MAADDRSTEHLVDGEYAIGDLVDLERLKRILQRFTDATGFTIGFLDHPDLNILIATGWRDICTVFHRENATAAENCLRSNQHLLDNLDEPGKVVVEACDNGLVDCATPIIIKGKHIASLATGQLLLEEPDLERFRRQAVEFGFDEKDYIDALSEIPVVSEEKLRSVTEFLGEMAMIISELGYTNLLVREEAVHLEKEISERKRVEEGLRESEERYRFLAEKMADIVWTLDLEFHTTYVSPSVEDVLGFTPEEWMNQTLEEMVAPDSLRRIQAVFIGELQREMDSGGDPDRTLTIEVEYNRKDGSTLWMENSVKTIRSPSGALTGMYGVSRDISARIAAEEERERLQAQLVQAQKMESVGRLAGGVAHDFNNALTVILGHTELALKQVPPSQQLHADLEQVRNAAESSAALTRQLLAFARKQTIRPQILDLNSTVESMLEMLRRLIGENIDLAWMPGDDLWPVEIDPGQIDQMLANLCVNARDAITGVGRISIDTGNTTLDRAYCDDHAGAVPGEYVILSVKDDGRGMEEEVIEHIFEPFFTTKEIGHGTGLGMATVYGIMKQNNGFIYVLSEPDEGTAIQLFLPRADCTTEIHDQRTIDIPAGHGETILLVEDNQSVRDLTNVLLKRLGYETLSAGTPVDALHIVQTHPGEIHLMLTDVVMPGMNGQDLVERVWDARPGMRCLFMSGYATSIITHPGMLDSGVGFLNKPFSMQELADKIRETLEVE